MDTYSDSINEAVIAAFIDRLKTIRSAQGFQTDAGLRVYDSQLTISDDDLEHGALTVWDDGERPDAGTANGTTDSMQMSLSVSVDALGLVNTEQTGQVLRKLKRDVKKCLLTKAENWLGVATDMRIGAMAYQAAEPLVRGEGSNAEGVRLRFVVRYPEGFGDPTRSL